MAIDRTRTVTLTTVPIEIVATLGLAPGEYRIENDIPDDSSIQSSGIIEFVAWDGPLPNPYTGATHTLRQGAREDIGIERGQKWYFWANRDGVDLTLTAAKAGGAIGGTPPQIRLPSFHVDIFKVFDSVGDIPDTAPVGGSYNLETAQLTPPDTWFETQQRLQSGQVEAHSRAIIDPNIDDPAVFTVDPIWSVPQQVNLIGTITGISTAPPLQGSGDAGRVVLGVQERGIYNRYLANNSIDLRTLDVGTANTYLGYDSGGNPAEITPRTMISEFDVPTYVEDKVLGVATGGTLEWTDQPVVPRDVEFFYGHVAPTNPEGESDVWFVDENASNIAMTYESDATTPRTNILKGDIYEWLPLTTTGSGWVYQANLDSAYTVVTDTTDGIMTHLDKIKLDSIATGAERNVQADWNVVNTTNDSYIQNKPSIPDAQIPSDWNQTTTTAVDYIKNKPTVLSDFDVPPYTNNDGRALGLHNSDLAWIDLGSFRLVFGTDFPANPATGNHFIFTGNVSSGLTGYTEIDTVTSRTSATVGDVATYDGSVWVYSGSINTRYSDATRTVSGLMSGSDKTKLDGIQVGAEANEKADWNENDSNSDAFIRNKPTIPDAQQPSDWDSNSGVTRILNKPTIHPAQIPSDWNQTDTDSLDYIKNKPTVATNIPNAPAAGSDDTVYELAVSSAGVYTWTTAFVPGVPTTSIGSSFPTNPAINDIHFQTANVSTNIPTNVRMSDGTTQQTALAVGEVYQFETEGTGTDQVWTLEGNLNTTYPNSSASHDGIITTDQFNKLAGIAAGAQVNVKSNWDETDTASDSYIQNKPDSITDFDAPVFEAADTGKVLGVNDQGDLEWVVEPTPNIPILTIGETFPTPTTNPVHPIENDVHFQTANITSDTDIPDNVKIADGSAKVTFVALGDTFRSDGTDWLFQGNIDTHYDEATDESPGLMSASDKEKLDTVEENAEANVQSDWAQSSSSAESFIRNKPTLPVVPGDATSSTAGLMSAANFSKLSGIASGAEVNVQSSWSETDTSSDAYIIDKPDIPTVPSHIPDAPAEESEQKRYELVVRESGSSHDYSSWEEAVDSGDDNVQSDWSETDTDSDAYIQNKPSDSDFGEKAFHNAPSDLTPAEKAILQGHIGLGENQIGEIAFRNPPNDLTDTDKDEVVSAIGAASSFDTSKLLPTFPSEGSRNGKVAKFNGNTLDWALEAGAGENTGEANVQSDWAVNDTASDAYIKNKPTLPVIPGNATGQTAGLMSSADFTKLAGVEPNAEENVQPDWDESDTDSDAYIDNKPTLQNLTDTEIGDKAFSNPPNDLTDTEKSAVRTAIGAGTGSGTGGLSTVSTDATITGDGSSSSPLSIANPFTDADETKLDGIAAGAEVNVQPDWGETDTSSDAYIDNKPTLQNLTDTEVGDKAFSNPPNDLTDTEKTAVRTAIGAGTGSGTGNVDTTRLLPTLPATGSRDNKIVKFDGDTLGWEDDALPSGTEIYGTHMIPQNSSLENFYDTEIVIAPEDNDIICIQLNNSYGWWNATEIFDGATWKALSSVTAGSQTNSSWNTRRAVNSAGRWVFAKTSANNLLVRTTGSGATTTNSMNVRAYKIGANLGGEENVQSNWTETDTNSDSFIQNKPTLQNLTDTQIGDKAFSNPPTDLTDDEKSAVRTAIGSGTGSGGLSTVSTNATISGDGTSGSPLAVANPFTAADETKLDGIATGAEVNVQVDWNESTTTSDAFIRNKPTLQNLTDAQIGDKAFSNSPTDLSDTEKADVRRNIDLSNSQVGVLAFRNPPGNLTSTQQGAVRTAIGAGTSSSSGEDNVQVDWNVTDTSSDAYILNKPTVPDIPSKPANPSSQTRYNLQLTTAGVASWQVDSGGGGGGSSTFTGLSDTPSTLGSSGQYLRVNSAGTALEFVAAPTGGGSSRYLPSPNQRSTEGGFLYMGWDDDFSGGWGIRRVSLSTGNATNATMTNNTVVANLTDAWSARTTLTYG